MASSSSSSVYCRKYDVFISFRGSDVRQGFLSHLHKALLHQNIEAFLDEQLERGKEISESLLGKIEESHVAIVIFSQNYAYSEWCLEELLKIAECRNTTGQRVIPVFYRVDPSHVQDLSESYGVAIAQHRTKFDEPLVEKWVNVLKDIASLSGLVSSNFNTESLLIEEIIKQAIEILNCLYPSDSDCDGGLVGIESRVEQVMSLLCSPEDVCIVGIWGEGGIGKTTVARATFDRIRSQFDSKCFVENVREESEKFTTDAIRNKVVSKLFGTSDCNFSRKRLSRKKVILVLDDVSDLDQINHIMRYTIDVGCGSRIIVTSRNRHLLMNLGAKIYAVNKLDRHEALQLFCLKAFGKKIPEEGYVKLSERAVQYAQGLPLALEVLGRNLFQRSAEEWEDELEQLKGTSDKKVHNILRISYEGLSSVEKEIFLDIACCFKGRMRHEVERLLDARGSKIGISRLAEKALISLSNHIKMHDLIQQMAKDIICEKEPQKRRWLWDPEDIRFLLSREMGTEAVKGIFLDMSRIGNINLSRTAFQKLYKLRYLHFYSSESVSAQINAPQGLEYLPEGLRYIYWDRYPSKSLPLTSCIADKLVELAICNSQIEELWNGVQNLPSLKKLDMSGSTKLIKVPDLSAASNLEELFLERCESLVEIPSSLKSLSKLALLLLRHCSRIESLPDDICHLNSLLLLDVSHCENLHGLPQNLGNLNSLKKLLARGSGIKEFPDSVCNLKACIELDVSGCANLHQLPQNLGDLLSLKRLQAVGSGIQEIPSSINKLRELRELTLRGSKVLKLPPLTGSNSHLMILSLTNLGMSNFPIGLCSVTSLKDLDLGGNNFESIPESIKHLLRLHSLSLSNCKELKYLPESIQHLSKLRTLGLRNCKELKYLPESLKSLPELRDLGMSGCISLDQNQCSNIMNHFMMEYEKGRRLFIPVGCHPGSEVPERMTYKNKHGSSLSFSFKLLQHILDQELEFYACVVSDRPIHLAGVKVNSLDQSELGDGVLYGGGGGPGLTWLTVKWELQFGREFLVKGREYAVELQFRANTDSSGLSSEGISGCGVIPLFDHQTVE